MRGVILSSRGKGSALTTHVTLSSRAQVSARLVNPTRCAYSTQSKDAGKAKAAETNSELLMQQALRFYLGTTSKPPTTQVMENTFVDVENTYLKGPSSFSPIETSDGKSINFQDIIYDGERVEDVDEGKDLEKPFKEWDGEEDDHLFDVEDNVHYEDSALDEEETPFDGSRFPRMTDKEQDKHVDALISSKPRHKLTDLQYFRFYPQKIQEVVANAKAGVGYFDEYGIFRQVDKSVYPTALANKPVVPHGVRQNADNIILPKDLVGQYRFGVKPEEVEGLSEKVKEWLSFKYATSKEVKDHRIQVQREKWRRTSYDSGSSEVQIAQLTERGNALLDHCKKNRKDEKAKRELRKLLEKRRKLLRYLKRTNVENYYKLIHGLNLKDSVWIKQT